MTTMVEPEVVTFEEWEFTIPCETGWHEEEVREAEWLVVFRRPFPCGCPIASQAWCQGCLDYAKGRWVCHHQCGAHNMEWHKCVDRVERLSHPNVG